MENWRDNITPEDVRGRSDAAKTLETNPEAALKIARAIRHPWYRCQAIAGVAAAQRSIPKRIALLEESLAAAFEQSEPNRIVSVAFWPVRQMVIGKLPIASEAVDRLLSTIRNEAHGLRKVDGIAALLKAVLPDVALRTLVLNSFSRAAAESAGWRTERIVADCALALAEHDVEAATKLVESRPENRFSSRAKEEIQKRSQLA